MALSPRIERVANILLAILFIGSLVASISVCYQQLVVKRNYVILYTEEQVENAVITPKQSVYSFFKP